MERKAVLINKELHTSFLFRENEKEESEVLKTNLFS
jgi:hypothetical protein